MNRSLSLATSISAFLASWAKLTSSYRLSWRRLVSRTATSQTMLSLFSTTGHDKPASSTDQPLAAYRLQLQRSMITWMWYGFSRFACLAATAS
ncbi:MAG: hypothetical protein HRT83_04265 [Hyphomicrobiaceae bacterium]|nr:hypothetical protein [Hyphomicrobiaceae bacterium]